MKLTWYGHACFRVESSEGSVVFDAYEPTYVPGLHLPPLAADMSLSSHLHHDHYCPEAVKLTRRAVGFKVGSLSVFHDDCRGKKRGENTIHILDTEGLRLVHLGDLGHPLSSEQIEALGSVDILLIPVGGFYTIDAKQAKQIVDQLNPRVVIPMHYRGDGFGFDVLAPVDDFLSLYEGTVKVLDGNSVEVTADTPAQVVVPRFIPTGL